MAVTIAKLDNTRVVRLFPEEVISQGNVELIDDIFTEDAIDHNGLSTTVGRQAIHDETEALLQTVGDASVTVEDVIADGNRVAIRWQLRGTNTGQFAGIQPTDGDFQIDVTMFARLEDGQIAERWILSDTLGMLQQVGVSEIPA